MENIWKNAYCSRWLKQLKSCCQYGYLSFSFKLKKYIENTQIVSHFLAKTVISTKITMYKVA